MLPIPLEPFAAGDEQTSSRLVRVAGRLTLLGALVAMAPVHGQDPADTGADFDLDALLGDPPSQDTSSAGQDPGQQPRTGDAPQAGEASVPASADAVAASPSSADELDVIAVGAQTAPPPVVAAPPRRAALEEIVVTAQKREENLQSVPLSVTAISGDDIVNKNMGDMNEVATYVPNLDVFATPSFPSIYMRGLGSSYNRGFEQSVAILIDDVYYGRASYINQATLDLAAIEVLRGPQGTLFERVRWPTFAPRCRNRNSASRATCCWATSTSSAFA